MAKKQSMGSNIGTWFEMGKATGADMPVSTVDIGAMKTTYDLSRQEAEDARKRRERKDKKNIVNTGTTRAKKNAQNNPQGETVLKADSRFGNMTTDITKHLRGRHDHVQAIMKEGPGDHNPDYDKAVEEYNRIMDPQGGDLKMLSDDFEVFAGAEKVAKDMIANDNTSAYSTDDQRINRNALANGDLPQGAEIKQDPKTGGYRLYVPNSNGELVTPDQLASSAGSVYDSEFENQINDEFTAVEALGYEHFSDPKKVGQWHRNAAKRDIEDTIKEFEGTNPGSVASFLYEKDLIRHFITNQLGAPPEGGEGPSDVKLSKQDLEAPVELPQKMGGQIVGGKLRYPSEGDVEVEYKPQPNTPEQKQRIAAVDSLFDAIVREDGKPPDWLEIENKFGLKTPGEITKDGKTYDLLSQEGRDAYKKSVTHYEHRRSTKKPSQYGYDPKDIIDLPGESQEYSEYGLETFEGVKNPTKEQVAYYEKYSELYDEYKDPKYQKQLNKWFAEHHLNALETKYNLVKQQGHEGNKNYGD